MYISYIQFVYKSEEVVIHDMPSSIPPPSQLFWSNAERDAFYRLVEQLLHENNTIRTRLEQLEPRKGITLSIKGEAHLIETETLVFNDYVLLKPIRIIYVNC